MDIKSHIAAYLFYNDLDELASTFDTNGNNPLNRCNGESSEDNADSLDRWSRIP